MQGFCNKIYDNAHDIIGWDPNKSKNNLERGTAVTADVSDVFTGGGIILEGEANMVQVEYLPIHGRL